MHNAAKLMSLMMGALVLLLPEIDGNMKWGVGVERGRTAVGFGACNEKTNYPYFGSGETPPCTYVPD